VVGIVHLYGRLQAREVRIPEGTEKIANTREALRPQAVESAGSITTLEQQTRPHKYPKVLRNSWPRSLEAPRDVTRGELTGTHELQDRNSTRLG